MFFADTLTLDAPRRTADGYLAVRAKAARTGVYQYSGTEVDPDNAHGLRDTQMVNVLRDEATVFDKKAVHSFIGKPITDNHPSVSVNSDNWRDHARGVVMGAEWQPGGYLAFDLMLTDAAAIKAVDNGKRELSNGYSCSLEFGDFTAADGTKCQAKQIGIVGNHVALVDKGRAGAECAIKDSVALCDANPAAVSGFSYKETAMKIKIGDAEVDATNGEAVRIAVDALNKNLADSATQIATLTTEAQTKDAKIATLEKAVADSKVTPAQLRDAAKAYAGVCDKAKALGVSFDDSADADAIMKAAVNAKMGDAAKDWTADQIAASFAVLTADTKVDPLRSVIADGVVNLGDAEKRMNDAFAKSVTDLNAWRNPAKASA